MNTLLTSVAVGGIADIAEIDTAKFTPAVMEYLVRIGLKNVLQDAHASITEKTDADETVRKAKKTAASMKKLDSLFAGETGQTRTRGDAVESLMRDLAETDLKIKIKAIGKKRGDYKNDVWKDYVGKMLKAKETAYRAAAEAKLAIKVESDVDISLDDIIAAEKPTEETPPTE